MAQKCQFCEEVILLRDAYFQGDDGTVCHQTCLDGRLQTLRYQGVNETVVKVILKSFKLKKPSAMAKLKKKFSIKG